MVKRIGWYNLRSGRSHERLAALSDGVFAFAMTLLLTDIHLPEPSTMHSEAQLVSALVALLPRLLVYVMSFLTLGIFWIGQQSQLSHLKEADRDVSWLHIAYLFLVAIIPLTSRLLADFSHLVTAVLCYWVVILLMGVTLWFAWRRAVSRRLLAAEVPAHFEVTYQRRILVAQSLYAAAALLSFRSTTASIVSIFLIQLGYALAIERWLPQTFRSEPESHHRVSS
jgi:uncharacterized membrane protein